jgi:hypothetical protein
MLQIHSHVIFQRCVCGSTAQVPLTLWMAAVIVIFAVSAFKLHGMQVRSQAVLQTAVHSMRACVFAGGCCSASSDHEHLSRVTLLVCDATSRLYAVHVPHVLAPPP